MSLMKRGGVYWSYVYVDNVRYQQSTGTANRKKAEDIEENFKEELNLKQHALPQFNPDMTFGELSARFIANAGPRPYHLDRLKPLLPYFSEMPIGRITKGMIREYRLARHEAKTLSEATVNRDIECLRHILYWAVDEGLLAANPLARLRLERERRKRRSVMSMEEELVLLAHAKGHLQKLIVTALHTGMRRGELLAQRWEDIDFPWKLIVVTHSKTPEGECREIPLTKKLSEMFSADKKDEGLIFTYEKQPIHSIKTAWKTAITKSNIRPYRFHDLRHTFNTRLMEAGVMQEIRKALMGHSSGEDVHATYTHVELPHKREAIRKLDVWMEEQLQAQRKKQSADREEQSATAAQEGGKD